MSVKLFSIRLIRHPLGMLYGILLFAIAISAALSMVGSGAWDAALVDLLMAGILITFMLRTVIGTFRQSREWSGCLSPGECFYW